MPELRDSMRAESDAAQRKTACILRALVSRGSDEDDIVCVAEKIMREGLPLCFLAPGTREKYETNISFYQREGLRVRIVHALRKLGHPELQPSGTDRDLFRLIEWEPE